MAALYAALVRGYSARSTVAPSWPVRIAPVLAIALVPSALIFGAGVHSFVATSVGSLLALGIVLAVRADLWYLYTAALRGTYYKYATGQRVVTTTRQQAATPLTM
jgi:hypothetical protein